MVNRIAGLDSLRGIAALIVVFNHLQLMLFPDFGDAFLYKYTFINWLINGRISVLLFFILSGFVLALPYMNGRNVEYKTYIIRRMCRIYLPFLFSALAAGALWYLVSGIPQSPVNFPWNEWGQHINIKSFMSMVFATGFMDSKNLNPPIWTLVIELRVAIIFPILVWWVRKFGIYGVVASVVAGFVSSKILMMVEPGSLMYFQKTVLGGVMLTIYYSVYFVFGIYLAMHLDNFKKLMAMIPAYMHGILGLVLFLIPVSAASLPYTLEQLALAGIGCYLIIACICLPKFEKFLLNAQLQWLGKISYSLYLTHMPVMFTIIYILYDTLPLYQILILAMPVVFIAAHLSQKYVEQPSIEFGKFLLRRVGKTQ